MTWADLGIRFNVEPVQKESMQRYVIVTLPGLAANQYFHEPKPVFDRILDALDVWKDASPSPFPSFYISQLPGCGRTAD